VTEEADSYGFLSHSTGLSLDNSLPSFQEYAPRRRWGSLGSGFARLAGNGFGVSPKNGQVAHLFSVCQSKGQPFVHEQDKL